MIVGDLNYDFTRSVESVIQSNLGEKLQDILHQYDLRVLNSEPTRVTNQSSILIDLMISSKDIHIEETRTLELGISDHMLIHGTIQMQMKRAPPRIVRGRSFKHFNENNFRHYLVHAPWSVCSEFDDPDDCYWVWCRIFGDICNDHAPYRQRKIRSVSLPWINSQTRHKMNLQYKIYLRAKRSDDVVLWTEYRRIRNEITFEVRKAKGNYYKSLFDEEKNTSVYWKLIKKATDFKNLGNITAMRNTDGSLVIINKEKAEALNEYFANVGDNLANRLSTTNSNPLIVSKVTSTITHIEISQDIVYKEILKLKPGKASCPDNISPKLLKMADKSIVPSLTSMFQISAQTNIVPCTWKNTNVSAVYKKEDEAERELSPHFYPLCSRKNDGVMCYVNY